MIQLDSNFNNTAQEYYMYQFLTHMFLAKGEVITVNYLCNQIIMYKYVMNCWMILIAIQNCQTSKSLLTGKNILRCLIRHFLKNSCGTIRNRVSFTRDFHQ